MDVAEIEKLIGEQFKGKEKLFDANKHALHLGRDWVMMNVDHPIGLALASAPMRSATASSSRAIRRRRSARSMAAPRSAPGIRSRRRSSLAEAFTRYCRRLRVDRDQEEQIRHRAGGGRTCLDRHRDRRRLERRARLHRDLRPGHFADAGISRPRLFRRNSGRRFSTCSAAGPRPACRRARSRPISSPAPMPRMATPSTCCCSRKTRRETFEFGARRLRSRRPAADAGVRDARSRYRHEPSAVPAARLGRRAQLRPRQGDDGGSARSRQGFRPLSRRRRRRHSLPHLSRHASDQGLLFHPRHLARPLRALHRGRRRLCRQHAAAVAQVRDRERPGAAAAASQRRKADQIRRDLFRLDLAGDGRGDRDAGSRAASISTGCGCAPSRSIPA